MLAQLRLAWWRETIGGDTAKWPPGEPLLGVLRSWRNGHPGLVPLVDAWDALTAPSPLGVEAIDAFAEGRGAACAALARQLGSDKDATAARQLGRTWALEDLAMRLDRAEEQEAARTLVLSEAPALPRAGHLLRPLRVLAGLARRRRIAGSEEAAASPGAVLLALKLGLLGL